MHGRHQYIPHVEIEVKPTPSIVSLVDSQTRFYLQTEQISSSVQFQHSHFRNADIDAYDAIQKNRTYSLDLGVANLQRVVNQLRALRSDSQYTFDPLASRAAGIPPYCEYLRKFSPRSIQTKSSEHLKR